MKTIGRFYAILTVVATAVMAYLKLTEKITTSWWWVFAPIWTSLLAAFSLLGVCYLIEIIWGAKIKIDKF